MPKQTFIVTVDSDQGHPHTDDSIEVVLRHAEVKVVEVTEVARMKDKPERNT